MSFIDAAKREINFKVVYFGPALVGKTTNLEWIHAHLAKPAGAEGIVCLATQTERALFFNFTPANTPLIRGQRCGHR
jgi:hypothetical protein